MHVSAVIKPVAFLLALASANAFGTDARVLALSSRGGHVAITHRGVDQWSPNERLCLFQDGASIGCGTVYKIQPKGAVVKLDQPSYRIRVGDVARRSNSRAPASVSNVISDSEDTLILEKTTFASRPRGLFNLTAGLGGSSTYRFPSVQIQMGLTRHLVLGVGPLLYSASVSDDGRPVAQQKLATSTNFSAANRPILSGFGGLATLTNYFGERYTGFFLSAGAGLTSLTLEGNGETQSKSEPFFMLTAGLRFTWQNSINIGVSAGATRAPVPSLDTAKFAEVGFQPLLLVDVGFNF